jgi:hypothetical protein
VFVAEPGAHRTAVACDEDTIALAVGGATGTIVPSAWEHWFAADPVARSGDPARAYEIAEEGLKDHPDHGSLLYNLACFASLAGMTDIALAHLAKAFAANPTARAWAAGDADLDAIRGDPRFPA